MFGTAFRLEYAACCFIGLAFCIAFLIAICFSVGVRFVFLYPCESLF